MFSIIGGFTLACIGAYITYILIKVIVDTLER